MSKKLGDKIQRLRAKKHYTLEKFAALSGVSKSYIWELENKHPPRPSADKLSKIAKALEVTLEYLFDNDDNVSEVDATDVMFFRKYQKMNPSTKDKVRKMIDLWEDD